LRFGWLTRFDDAVADPVEDPVRVVDLLLVFPHLPGAEEVEIGRAEGKGDAGVDEEGEGGDDTELDQHGDVVVDDGQKPEEGRQGRHEDGEAQLAAHELDGLVGVAVGLLDTHHVLREHVEVLRGTHDDHDGRDDDRQDVDGDPDEDHEGEGPKDGRPRREHGHHAGAEVSQGQDEGDHQDGDGHGGDPHLVADDVLGDGPTAEGVAELEETVEALFVLGRHLVDLLGELRMEIWVVTIHVDVEVDGRHLAVRRHEAVDEQGRAHGVGLDPVGLFLGVGGAVHEGVRLEGPAHPLEVRDGEEALGPLDAGEVLQVVVEGFEDLELLRREEPLVTDEDDGDVVAAEPLHRFPVVCLRRIALDHHPLGARVDADLDG